MGPKKKGGKKRKKKGKKKEKIPEIPAEYYEGEILRLNHILSELRDTSYNEVIRFEELQQKKEQLIVNRKDVNIFLDRTLESHMQKITVLETKIKETKKIFEADRQKAEVEIQAAKTNWTKWNNILESDVRILDGRILQFQKDKEKLFEILWKQQIYQQKAKTQESNYKIEKYDKEREIIILKYDLATEVEKRLYILALNYENTIDMRVSTYAKQLIRENVSLNWEMDRLIKINRRLQAACDDLDIKTIDRKIDLNISATENKRLFKTIQRQKRIILILSGKLRQSKSQFAELRHFKNNYNAEKYYYEHEMHLHFDKLDSILDILNKYRELSKLEIERISLKTEHYRNGVNELTEYFKQLLEKIQITIANCAECSKTSN